MIAALVPFLPTIERWAVYILLLDGLYSCGHHAGAVGERQKAEAAAAKAEQLRTTQIADLEKAQAIAIEKSRKEVEDARASREAAEKGYIANAYASKQRCTVPVLAGRVRERANQAAGVPAVPGTAAAGVPDPAGPAAGNDPGGQYTAGAIGKEAETCEGIRRDLARWEAWYADRSARYEAFRGKMK